MKDKHIILKNIFSIGTARTISLLFPLLILPYLIATIGIDEYGLIIFALAFAAYFNSIVDYSFSITAVRSISSYHHDVNKQHQIMSEVLNTKIFLLIIASMIGVLLILVIPFFADELPIFLIIFSSLIGYALSPEWFFMGTERMEYIAFLLIGFKGIHTLSIFLFIHSPADSWIYALILSAEKLLVAIAALIIMRVKFNVKWHMTSMNSVRSQLVTNSSLFINQLLPNLYNNSATLILGFFWGAGVTGVFGIIRKIVNLGESLLSITSKVFFPAINRSRENRTALIKTQWTITAGIIILIGLLSPLLPVIFEELDYNATFPLMIMAFGIIGLTLYDIYGLQFFLVEGRDQLVMKNTLLFSILGFLIAFPAIYWSGLIGATWIVAATRIAIGARLMFLSKTGAQ